MTSKLVRELTVTISDGQSLSNATPDLDQYGKLTALILDSAWDTNDISFQVSVDGETFYNLESGQNISGAVASTYYPVPSFNAFLAVNAIKVRSGTAAAAAAQSGDTVVTLLFWQVEG